MSRTFTIVACFVSAAVGAYLGCAAGSHAIRVTLDTWLHPERDEREPAMTATTSGATNPHPWYTA
jgi:hypothetical protein